MSKPTIADQLHLAGQIEQARIDGKPVEWQYYSQSDEAWIDSISGSPGGFVADKYEIRLKPALKQVPLGPEDVPPGSVLNVKADDFGYRTPVLVAREGVVVASMRADDENSAVNARTWWELMAEGWQINTSIPLTGKWDPNAWTACFKTVEEVLV